VILPTGTAVFPQKLDLERDTFKMEIEGNKRKTVNTVSVYFNSFELHQAMLKVFFFSFE
jgi:hypothetical protein